jgi:hypothetical protein
MMKISATNPNETNPAKNEHRRLASKYSGKSSPRYHRSNSIEPEKLRVRQADIVIENHAA